MNTMNHDDIFGGVFEDGWVFVRPDKPKGMNHLSWDKIDMVLEDELSGVIMAANEFAKNYKPEIVGKGFDWDYHQADIAATEGND